MGDTSYCFKALAWMGCLKFSWNWAIIWVFSFISNIVLFWPYVSSKTLFCYKVSVTATKTVFICLQLNFAAMQILALILAFIYRIAFSPRSSGATLRHCLALGFGTAIGTFCFGRYAERSIHLVMHCRV